MQLKLSCDQIKIDQCNNAMFYVGFMVTTKQKPTLDIHKRKIKESKHTTMENHQTIMIAQKKKVTIEQK